MLTQQRRKMISEQNLIFAPGKVHFQSACGCRGEKTLLAAGTGSNPTLNETEKFGRVFFFFTVPRTAWTTQKIFHLSLSIYFLFKKRKARTIFVPLKGEKRKVHLRISKSAATGKNITLQPRHFYLKIDRSNCVRT